MEKFWSIYELENNIVDNANFKPLGNKNVRSCRFCKQKPPTATFKKIAHLMPQLMGNKRMTTYFECDICNTHFSKYETSLASYIGCISTLLGIKGKKGIPKVKKKVTAYPNDEYALTAERKSEELVTFFFNGKIPQQNVIINEDGVSIKIAKSSYIPREAFKALLHTGISMIHGKDLKKFEIIREFLLDENKISSFTSHRLILMQSILSINEFKTKPTVFIFSRKSNCVGYFSKAIVISFSSIIYQFFIPSDEDLMSEKQGISFHYPHFCTDDPKYKGPLNSLKFSSIDLTSADKVINEEEIIGFPGLKPIKEGDSYKTLDSRTLKSTLPTYFWGFLLFFFVFLY